MSNNTVTRCFSMIEEEDLSFDDLASLISDLETVRDDKQEELEKEEIRQWEEISASDELMEKEATWELPFYEYEND